VLTLLVQIFTSGLYKTVKFLHYIVNRLTIFAEPRVLHSKFDDLCIQQYRECTMCSMIHRDASFVSKLMLQWLVPKESINCEHSRFI